MLPICGKIFEKLIFNEMFKFFIEIKLISPNQSGLKSCDSRINQLLAITLKCTNHLTDEGFKVTGVFLEISKASDKVRHEGFIFKLK